MSETQDQLLIEYEQQERWRDLLGEVLAVLNGDGGHYQTEHGAGRAAIEGIRRYYQLLAQAEALADALRNQGLLQNTFHGKVWHIHDCPASFDFSECHYRCRVAREAFALAGTEPYVSQETRRDTEVYK